MKNATDYAQNTAQKFEAEMKFLFKRVDSIFTNLLFDENIEKIMLSPYTSNTPQYLKSMQVQFSTYSIMNCDIIDIALVNENMSWSNMYDSNTLKNFLQTMNNNYQMQSFGIQQSSFKNNKSSQKQHLVFGRNLYGMHDTNFYGKSLGGIVISIDPSKSSVSLPTSERGSTYFVLADTNSNIFPFNCSSDEGQNILAQCGTLSNLKKEKTNVIDTLDFKIYITSVPNENYYMISAIDRKALNRDVINATILIVTIVLAALSILVALMYTILHNMVTPLDKLSRHIQKIIHKPLNNRYQEVILDGCYEINTLSQYFADLLKEEEHLKSELYITTVTLYETKLEKKQAELDFLRSQINPHFLYNALESVKDIALEQNVPQIATIASSMGKLFRYNVKGNTIVPLKQEIAITQAYLDIQQARFPNKIDVIYSIRENVNNIPIIKFLLQPLVENAVYHGLEPKQSDGILFIGARLHEENLVITIQDDGIGISEDKLTSLKYDLSNISTVTNFSGKHIGLLNVQHRILLTYGANYGISIDSQENIGTKITLIIPPPQIN